MRPVSLPACPTLALALAAVLAPLSGAWAAPASCQAASGKMRLSVVELYTSEGCNSCPPADRWLSTLKGRDDVLAQAFHVDYWDSLGWKDRFSDHAYTQRQEQLRATNGARFIYTPQIVVDGVDRRELGVKNGEANVSIALARDGDVYTASVTPLAQAPARLAAYWTVTESGHSTAVKAGENSGATLRHDFVVREYRPVDAWASQAGTPQRLQFKVDAASDAGHPRQVNLVIVDTATGRPLQALRLDC